jgi:hypothetical protein
MGPQQGSIQATPKQSHEMTPQQPSSTTCIHKPGTKITSNQFIDVPHHSSLPEILAQPSRLQHVKMFPT